MTLDKTTARAVNTMLADLANDGGGTYESGTLLPFRPATGFAVALGGIHLPSTMLDAELLARFAKAVATEHAASYVGTWLKGGFVYIDAVKYFSAFSIQQALTEAREAGQQAIYSFSEQKDITL